HGAQWVAVDALAVHRPPGVQHLLCGVIRIQVCQRSPHRGVDGSDAGAEEQTGPVTLGQQCRDDPGQCACLERPPSRSPGHDDGDIVTHWSEENLTAQSPSSTPGHTRTPSSSSFPAPILAPSPITAERITQPGPITAPAPMMLSSTTLSAPICALSNSTDPTTCAPADTTASRPTAVPAVHDPSTWAPAPISTWPGDPGNAGDATRPSTMSALPRAKARGVPRSNQ